MYTMKEKLPPTTSNRRKRELDRADPKHPNFEYAKTYNRKRKTVEKRTMVPPNTVEQLGNFETTNEGVRQNSKADTMDYIEDGDETWVTVGSEIHNESVQAALGAYPTLGECHNRTDSEVNTMSVGGNYECSAGDNYEGAGAANIKDIGPIDTNLPRSFKFQRVRSIALGQIFIHFPKLPRIPKELDSDNYKHCTYWKWGGSVTDRNGGLTLLKFRDVLDNCKVEDDVWDPYRNKRDSAHAFKEITYFYGALASPDHVQPYYPNRVVRQFTRE
ncbi:hypothetical protein GIB67_023864 [Kingdonia uniflora]|uniref:Uncharacterized protein n=1 Tax=Kingdonia uniflora TaxID=39325 RepID=A0A7J7NGK1_9MAGN|nr:hypothetical protein GIB67_023864 [Kingdonia uniflora]